MTKRIFLALVFSVFAIAGGLSSSARAEVIYGITATTPVETDPAYAAVSLVRFDSATPGVFNLTVPITGIVAGHALRSIDFRPLTGVLYGISNGNTAATYANAQLYTINIATGVCTPKGPAFTLTGTVGPGTPTANDKPQIEMEFNPVADRIRVLTAANVSTVTGNPLGVYNNFVVHPDTGAIVSVDSVLRYANPPDPNTGVIDNAIVAAAYTRPSGGQTTLYGWDQGGATFGDDLVTIGSVNGTPDTPGSGIMHSVAATQFTRFTYNPASAVGMDISPDTGTLFATVSIPNGFNPPVSGLYTRNLATAAVTLINNFPALTFVVDMSVARTTTAAGVEISGRVSMGEGARGLANANVTLTDGQGKVRSVLTGRNGAYSFSDVEVGQTYIISVVSRRFSFEPRVIQITDSATNVDFEPAEGSIGTVNKLGTMDR